MPSLKNVLRAMGIKVDVGILDFVVNTLKIDGTELTATAAELNALDGITSTVAELNAVDGIPVTWTVALAASATTDGMEVTITAKDAAGATVAAAIPFEFWFTDAATGIGLTADSFSGALTAPSVGAIHTALTAKKHVLGITAASGIATLLIVDSANPTDVYAAVRKPLGNGVVVSVVSGTNWEGAA